MRVRSNSADGYRGVGKDTGSEEKRKGGVAPIRRTPKSRSARDAIIRQSDQIFVELPQLGLAILDSIFRMLSCLNRVDLFIL